MGTTATKSATTIVEIDPLDISPHPCNARTQKELSKSDPDMQELMQSIRTSRLHSPIQVRVRPAGSPTKYELIFGERRLNACKHLHITVRSEIVEMDDVQALQTLLTENKQRKDPNPILEAKTIAALIEAGDDLKTIAERIGKTYSWAVRRAALCNLTKTWMDGHAKGDYNWTIDALALVARYPQEVQERLYEDLVKKTWNEDQHTVETLTPILAKYHRVVAQAPWDVQDAQLVPTAGACAQCPSRSSCQGYLFDDPISGKADKTDRCLNDACWESKQQAYLQIREADLRAKYPALVRVSDDYNVEKGVYRSHSWEKCKKSDEAALPAMKISQPAPGTFLWIRPVGGQVRAAGPAQAAIKRGEEPTPEQLATELLQKQEELAKRREILTWKGMLLILEALAPKPTRYPWTPKESKDEDEDLGVSMRDRRGSGEKPEAEIEISDQKAHKPTFAALIAWTIMHGVEHPYWMEQAGAKAQAILMKSEQHQQTFLWEAAHGTMRAALLGIIRSRSDEHGIADQIVTMLGIDRAKLIAHAGIAIPVPKAWSRYEQQPSA